MGGGGPGHVIVAGRDSKAAPATIVAVASGQDVWAPSFQS